MTMTPPDNICAEGHREIGFDGDDRCPLCAAFKACSAQVKYYEEVSTKRRLSMAEQSLLDGHKAALEQATKET